jgi:hypothetical protein
MTNQGRDNVRYYDTGHDAAFWAQPWYVQYPEGASDRRYAAQMRAIRERCEQESADYRAEAEARAALRRAR